MTQDKTESKRWMPNNMLMGIFDDVTEGRKAARELIQAGFRAENVELLDKEAMKERVDAESEKGGVFERTFRAAWNAVTLYGLQYKEAQDAAKEGSRIILIHLESGGDTMHAQNILLRHGVRQLEHYDSNGTMTQLAA